MSTVQHSRIARGWHRLSRWFGERGLYWFVGYLFVAGSIGTHGIHIESAWFAASSVLVVFYCGHVMGRIFEEEQTAEEKREWKKANTRPKTREERALEVLEIRERELRLNKLTMEIESLSKTIQNNPGGEPAPSRRES